MSVRQYVGARYVPRFSTVNDGVWDNTYSYEALEIVKYGNDYYTSKKPVPTGVAISNTEYWVLTGNYNGAIGALDNRLTTLENETIPNLYTQIENDINNVVSMGIDNTGVTDISTTLNTLLENNHVLYFPKGRYLVNNTINVNADTVELYGTEETEFYTTNETSFTMFEITGDHVKLNNFTIKGVFNVTNLLHFNGANFSRVNNIKLTDCSKALIVNNTSKESFFGNIDIRQFNLYGIETNDCNDIYFNTFLIINEYRQGYGDPRGTSIYVHGRNESVDFAHGDIVGGLRTLNISGAGGSATNRNIPQFNRFTDVYFDSSRYDNIIESCEQLKFIGCWFSYAGHSYLASEQNEGSSVGLHVVNSKNMVFSSCDFCFNGDTGLIDENGRSNKYIGCIFIGNNRYNRTTPKYGSGMSIYGTSQHIGVIGCVFDNDTRTSALYGISIEDTSAKISISDCTIKMNNKINNSGTGAVDINNEMSSIPALSGVSALATLNTRRASYTATTNCYVIGSVEGSDGTGTVSIDGIIFGRASEGNTTAVCFPLAKGRTLTTRENAGNYNLTVVPNESVLIM